VIRQRMEAAYDHVAAQYAEQNAIMPQLLVELAIRFLARLEPGAHILIKKISRQRLEKHHQHISLSKGSYANFVCPDWLRVRAHWHSACQSPDCCYILAVRHLLACAICLS
jgi:hypothetical protein